MAAAIIEPERVIEPIDAPEVLILMHRFFVSPTAFNGQLVTLTGDQAHQVRRVLRMRLGDRITVLDNRGWAYESILVAVGDDSVKFQVVRRWASAGEPRTHITLLQAVLKGDRFGWALQKGTEIGVSQFVPLICERNVVKDLDAVEQKRARWERIIREAAEQSGRARLPQLAPAQLFPQAIQPDPMPSDPSAASPLRLIPWEDEPTLRLKEALAGCNFARGARIQVFVGPEGGFTEEEVHLARRYGVKPVSLGPRILRAETAGVVAAAVILYAADDMAPRAYE